MNDVIESQEKAIRTTRRYVCAGCYGPLIAEPVDSEGNYKISCPTCGDGRGFVTRSFADGRRSDSVAEAADVRPMLRQIGVIQRKSEQQLLQELGV